MTEVLVIYHNNCNDGFTAAWIAKNFFRSLHTQVSATFLPLNYGQQFDMNLCRNKWVYLLDFSFKRSQMLAIMDIAKAVIVLDHHQTAQKELDGLDLNGRHTIVFDMERSGAAIAWNHFMDDNELPPLVQYVQDRDLWRWNLPNSKEINAALASYPRTFEVWNALHEKFPSFSLVVEGRAILRGNEQIIAQHVERATMRVIDGFTVPVVNATVLFSEIAGELAIGHPFGACYFDRKDGNRQFSLRSTPEGVDVSEIARKFNGGGHKHAAGFEMLMVRADDLA